MKTVSVALHEATLNQVRSLGKVPGKSPGDILNNILDEYRTSSDIAAAIARHLDDPVVDETPIKRTSVYMTETYVDRLRAFINKTYLPFDATVRILVQDYLNRRRSTNTSLSPDT